MGAFIGRPPKMAEPTCLYSRWNSARQLWKRKETLREAEGRYKLFAKVCFIEFPPSQLLALDDRNVTFFLEQDRYLSSHGISSPAFKKEKKCQGVFSACATFQVPLTRSNPYAIVAYFGVRYFANLQVLGKLTLLCDQSPESFHLAELKPGDNFPILQLPLPF